MFSFFWNFSKYIQNVENWRALVFYKFWNKNSDHKVGYPMTTQHNRVLPQNDDYFLIVQFQKNFYLKKRLKFYHLRWFDDFYNLIWRFRTDLHTTFYKNRASIKILSRKVYHWAWRKRWVINEHRRRRWVINVHCGRRRSENSWSDFHTFSREAFYYSQFSLFFGKN